MSKNHLTCVSANCIFHRKVGQASDRKANVGDERRISTMNSMAKYYVRARETLVGHIGGQTMTEYALILAAIAVVVYGVYAAMGNNIGSLANGVDSSLTNA